MNMRFSFTALVLLLGTVVVSAQQGSSAADRTLAPFFFVDTDDPSVDQLPLKSVAAQVHIAGVIADVTIEQVYRNEGTRPLEAIYIFPASTRAAVYDMVMHTGDREIIAEIREREEARREYEEARERGQTASLLEQERPNVFQNERGQYPAGRLHCRASVLYRIIGAHGKTVRIRPAPLWSVRAILPRRSMKFWLQVVPSAFPTCTRAKIPTTPMLSI